MEIEGVAILKAVGKVDLDSFEPSLSWPGYSELRESRDVQADTVVSGQAG